MTKTVVEKFLSQVDWKRVEKKVLNANTGDQLWPSRTPKNDTNANLRVDAGSKHADGTREIVMQANKNAKDPSIRKLAEKNSHDVLAKAKAGPNMKDEMWEDWKERNDVD